MESAKDHAPKGGVTCEKPYVIERESLNSKASGNWPLRLDTSERTRDFLITT